MKKPRDRKGRFRKSDPNENKIKHRIVYLAILCVTAIEIVALINGINGAIQALSLTIIGALAGIVFPTPKFLRRR